MRLNPKLLLLIAIGVCFGFSFLAGSRLVNAYYLDIVLGIGINIILAVSLNLINGYTGQFSLGHAGFMAVGAYVTASIMMFAAPHLLPMRGGADSVAGLSVLFFFALAAAGLVAAVVGFLVGVPSLRLRGDYLAIVTLGFGEIIRVMFQNIQAVGGPSGLKGIPPYTSFFWTYAWAMIAIYTVLALVH